MLNNFNTLNQNPDHPLICFDNGYQQYFLLDQDELMLLLLSSSVSSGGECLGVDFAGNNSWPMSWFYKYYQPESGLLVLQKLFGEWTGGSNITPIMKIIPNKDTWSAQVWFRQSPDLCWAVYETCADESVCE